MSPVVSHLVPEGEGPTPNLLHLISKSSQEQRKQLVVVRVPKAMDIHWRQRQTDRQTAYLSRRSSSQLLTMVNKHIRTEGIESQALWASVGSESLMGVAVPCWTTAPKAFRRKAKDGGRRGGI